MSGITHGIIGEGRDRRAFLLLFLLLLGTAGQGAEEMVAKAVRGTMDLRSWNLERGESLPLLGAWEFRWEQFLDPMAPPAPGTGSLFLESSANWREIVTAHGNLPSEGFGTFRVSILLPPRHPLLALEVPSISTSFRLFANGRQIFEAGNATPGREGFRADLRHVLVPLPDVDDRLDLVIHVANYGHQYPGMWGPLHLGTHPVIQRRFTRALGFDLFVLGGLLMLGGYNLVLFFYRRRDRAPLFFALFCLQAAIRLVIPVHYALGILKPLPWEVVYRAEYLTLGFSGWVFSRFLDALLPGRVSPLLMGFLGWSCLGYSSFVLFTQPLTFSQTVGYNQVILLLLAAYVLILLGRELSRGTESAAALLVGSAILAATTLNDILYARALIDTGYWFPVGVFLFFFFQAANMALAFARAFNRAEALSAELSIVNEVSQAVTFMGDLHKTLDTILSHAVKALKAERGSILLLDDRYESLIEESVVFGLAGKVQTDPDLKAKFKIGEGIAGEVFHRGISRLIEDSLICVPLQVRESSIGVMNVGSKTSGSFDQEDLQLALTMANQAAVVIEKARLFHLATIDGLTGLIVHRHFQSKLEEEFRRSKRYSTPLSLLMTDVDHFKKFNDTWGHQTGDLVLREVARCVQATIRETDVAARYGGEEFAVILPETDGEGARRLAERIRQKVESLELSGLGKNLRVTISLGVIAYPQVPAESTLEMIRLADEALYQAKHSGRNRVGVYGETVATLPSS